MSDDIEAIKLSDVTFQLTALQVPASQTARMARTLRSTAGWSHAINLFLLIYLFALAAVELWFVWSSGTRQNDESWLIFWIAVLALLIWIPVSGWSDTRRDVNIQQPFYLHRGIQALRQAAAFGDDRLAPLVKSGVNEATDGNAGTPVVGRFQRIGAQSRGVGLLVIGVVLILFAASILGGWPVDLSFSDTSMFNLPIIASTVFLIEGVWSVIVGAQWLRPFEVGVDEQGIRWRQPTFGFGRHTVRAQWPDVRAFVTFRASKEGKASADQDEIFLLDATKQVVAWKMTPKTPPDVRATHKRFVRMVSERAHLRDITASLKNLLESPETRSYEYTVTVLSTAAPAHPEVRKALVLPEWTPSRFLRGYLFIAAILLALLVAAGLLLQFGIIPAGSF